MAIYDRICKQCGAEFKGGPRAWYCPNCRAVRRKAADSLCYDRKKKGVARSLGSIDICVACGEPYVVRGGLQKYCPECAPEEIKKNDRVQGLKYYWQNKDDINPVRNAKRATPLTEHQCKICGKTFWGYRNRTLCDSPECKSENIRRRNRLSKK